MIYSVAFGGALKCPRKINLNTQWGVAMGVRGSIVLSRRFWWLVVFNKPHKIEI